MVKQQTYKLYYRQISENFWFEPKILHCLGLNHIINMRHWCNVSIRAFQALGESQNLLCRSNSLKQHQIQRNDNSKRFYIANLAERGLMLFIRGMAKLADAPVVHTGGEEPRTGSSPVAAHYMGQTTSGELGLTANQNVLVIQVLESYSSCPAIHSRPYWRWL